MTRKDMVLSRPIDMADDSPIVADEYLLPPTNFVSIDCPDWINLSNQNENQNENQIMDGHGMSLPSVLQGEAMNSFVSVANFSQPVNCETVKDLSVGSSYPINGAPQIQNDFLRERTPLSAVSLAYLLAARNGAYENPEKFEASAATLPYSTQVTRGLGSNSYSDIFNPSCGSLANHEFSVLPVDMSRKCDFDKSNAPTEIMGTVMGRTAGSQPFQLPGNINPGVWFSAERASSSSSSPSGSSRFSNELSLSLTTTPPQVACGTSIQDQFSELSCSGVTSNPFRERAFGLEQAPCTGNKNLSLNFDSYKPVQLSQFLSGSRYLAVMQEILSQIAKYSLENLNSISYPTNLTDDGEHSPFSLSCSAGTGRGLAVLGADPFPYGAHRTINRVDAETKRKHLLALLQAVDDRYSQCLDELHMVVSAFHAVTELHHPTSIHTHFALQTVSFLYKNLRERISTFILAMGEQYSSSSSSTRSAREEKSFEASFIQKQWTLQQLRKKDHQLWRPQRGLPERSVSVLRAWMFQNFLHPYPKDTEKHLLAVKSGLTRSQVSNWFINARVRLWKPMIEEMYAEMNRRNHNHNHHQNEEEMNGCRNQWC
nr:homeobox protein ATH1-like [Ipomoea batatas]